MWGSFLYTVQAGKNNTWIKLIIYQVLFSTVLLILVAIVPCPPPGNLPNPGIEPKSPALQVDSLLTEPPGKPHACLN